MTGTIISETNRGFCFAEAEETHQCVFIHINQVKGERCLHIGDRVKFDLIPNPSQPGRQMGGNVEYQGRVITRQIGENKKRPIYAMPKSGGAE